MRSQSLHTLFTDAISEQRASAGTSKLNKLVAAQMEFGSDVDVLNYALTLEHLESGFYKLAADYTLGSDAFGNSIDEWVAAIGGHEDAHVETLISVITSLDGEPVEAAEYDFGVTDAASFLATAAVLENVGVAAYDGAGQFIENADLLTAAGSIVAVEARHASYLNLITGAPPFPSAVEIPMTPDEVIAAATPFFVQP